MNPLIFDTFYHEVGKRIGMGPLGDVEDARVAVAIIIVCGFLYRFKPFPKPTTAGIEGLRKRTASTSTIPVELIQELETKQQIQRIQQQQQQQQHNHDQLSGMQLVEEDGDVILSPTRINSSSAKRRSARTSNNSNSK